MKILYLPIKKQWFDMIASGEKKEEYRDITSYWTKRLLYADDKKSKLNENDADDLSEALKYVMPNHWDLPKEGIINYDKVIFSNGYGKNVPKLEVEFKGLSIGSGRTEWGAIEDVGFFKIQLGEIINKM